MNTVIKILLVLVVAVPAVMLATVLKNGLPLNEAPGALARLKVYLNTHVAETRPDHEFAELQSRVVPDSTVMAVRERIVTEMQTLGWTVLPTNATGPLQAEVTTPLLRFTDDVQVRLSPVEGGVQVDLRAESRVGRSDMGTNARHILNLYAALGL